MDDRLATERSLKKSRRDRSGSLRQDDSNHIARKPVPNALNLPEILAETLPGSTPDAVEGAHSRHGSDAGRFDNMGQMSATLPSLPGPAQTMSAKSASEDTRRSGSKKRQSGESHRSSAGIPDASFANVRSVPQSPARRRGEQEREAAGSSSVPRSSLEKPLPEPPLRDAGTTAPPGIRHANPKALYDSVDTSVHTREAPAVTHETVREDVHEHEHRQITREIHNHHIFHRILPIHDVEVLPAVHYVSDRNGIREVSEDEIPSQRWKHAQRSLAEGLRKSLPKDSSAPGRRQFTARTFEGTDEDDKEYPLPDGGTHTEKWWVHPPTVATGAKDRGQTQPFHIPRLPATRPND